MATDTERSHPGDTPDQAAFRQAVRGFLAANARPKQEAGPWNVSFHTDPADARRLYA